MKKLKELTYNQILNILNAKIEEANDAIESAKEAMVDECKSCVGDKFETGRAMMQLEIDKIGSQLSNTINHKRELNKIHINHLSSKVVFGSFIVTNHGKYFISVGMGKIKLENDFVFAISLASPIGKVFINKEIGDIFEFQGREFEIQNIV